MALKAAMQASRTSITEGRKLERIASPLAGWITSSSTTSGKSAITTAHAPAKVSGSSASDLRNWPASSVARSSASAVPARVASGELLGKSAGSVGNGLGFWSLAMGGCS